MPRSYRFARSPGWVAGHALVLALAVTMGFLGHWQLDVSNAKHFALQNFGYALQWWAFALFTIGMWLRILRDHARRPAAGADTEPLPARPDREATAPVAYRRYVMPQSTDVRNQPEDAEHAAYNAYLAGLNRAAGDEEKAQ